MPKVQSPMISMKASKTEKAAKRIGLAAFSWYAHAKVG